MGHERLGALPRSKRWEEIIDYLADYSESSQKDVGDIAKKTIQNVRSRIPDIKDDPGIKAAFEFLIHLSLEQRKENVSNKSDKIDLPDNPTPLHLIKSANKWIEQNKGSEEYSRLALNALSDAITAWHKNHQTNQSSLFESGDNSYDIWKDAGKGSGFSELSRNFFSSFVKRYLNYFLEREASTQIKRIEDRDKFADAVARHSYETAKITQSLAAGWFNKHTKNKIPSQKEINDFLDFSFSKINEELLREED